MYYRNHENNIVVREKLDWSTFSNVLEVANAEDREEYLFFAFPEGVSSDSNRPSIIRFELTNEDQVKEKFKSLSEYDVEAYDWVQTMLNLILMEYKSTFGRTNDLPTWLIEHQFWL